MFELLFDNEVVKDVFIKTTWRNRYLDIWQFEAKAFEIILMNDESFMDALKLKLYGRITKDMFNAHMKEIFLLLPVPALTGVTTSCPNDADVYHWHIKVTCYESTYKKILKLPNVFEKQDK